jgi:hypothetical protein
MRVPDRDLLAVVMELQAAVAAGGEPKLTDAELASLAAFIESIKPDRRGHHKSKARHAQGANRRMLRDVMEWRKIKLRNDPAELEIKRAARASGDVYDFDWRVALRMRERLVNAGWENPPNVAALKNILRRSTAKEPDEEQHL